MRELHILTTTVGVYGTYPRKLNIRIIPVRMNDNRECCIHTSNHLGRFFHPSAASERDAQKNELLEEQSCFNIYKLNESSFIQSDERLIRDRKLVFYSNGNIMDMKINIKWIHIQIRFDLQNLD